MEKENIHSEDPISEAMNILEDTTISSKNGTKNTISSDKNDSSNVETDRSENMSSEQNFWFKLARSDLDETE